MTAIPLPYLPPVTPPTIAWDVVLTIANVVVSVLAVKALSDSTKDKSDAKPDAAAEECGDTQENTSEEKAKEPKKRSPYRIGKRKVFKTRKEAYEAAKKAGKGREPRLDYNDPRAPHYHPDVPKGQGPMTPNQPSPHDHYYFPKGR